MACHPIRAAALAALVALLPALIPDPVAAQVYEERRSESNPMVEIFKSTIYGALAGLVVGGAIELIQDDGDGEAVRWGMVSGTFLGLGVGIYYVVSRPKVRGALLEGDMGGFAFRAPVPTIERPRATPAALAGLFPPDEPAALEARVLLASVRF